MAKKANILSFGDAQRNAPTIPVDHDSLRKKGRGKKSHGRRGRKASKASNAQKGRARTANDVRTLRDTYGTNAAYDAINTAHAQSYEQPLEQYSSEPYSRNAAQYSSRRNSQKSRRNSARSSRAASGATTREKSGRLASLKRNLTKNKAGRAYQRQFGDEGSAPPENAPRAAVYTGQMGSRQRQAARMQRSATPSASNKRRTWSGKGSSITTSPRFIGTMAVVVCVALTCVFLYPAAQQYYQSVREHDQLMAEYTAVNDRNTSLEASVDSLSTDDGIAAAAHDQLGWVQEGEQVAHVKGLSKSATETSAGNVYANINSGSVDMPETWYSPVLDVVFGVE